MLKNLILTTLLTSAVAAFSAPTNSILFVTQAPIPQDFTTIGSLFGNHQSSPDSCGRGGDLYIRYPDGTVKNLTRAAGFGVWGAQHTNGIAVRQPSVHWSGKKAVFSMVVGAPKQQYDYATQPYWQLYEITNFLSAGSVPVITKVPNQPTNYNNISPVYGTDDRIIFTSDRPRNGQRHLYPQLDEYEEAPTVTGLWSLNPTNGDLFILNHSPSGAFTPIVDTAGRVIFTRWDHLQRDQQADADAADGNNPYGTFNWTDESANSVATTNRAEVFPEPRSGRDDLLAGTGLAGHSFNHFFPWQIFENGMEEETLNHVGRHELGGSYRRASHTNDPNIQDLYYFGNKYNTNVIDNFLMMSEDPRTPGLFYGIDAPEFGSHSCGQIISITGATNLNADFMRITYLTPRSTHSFVDPSDVPPDHTGLYRNPIMTTDGYMIAAHTFYKYYEGSGGTAAFPDSKYDLRLKFLTFTNGYYVPGATLTSGLTNRASYWSPDDLVTHTNTLWELDPVEVVARQRPTRLQPKIEQPELNAFATAGVDIESFKSYLRTHELALVVSRDVTTRDKNDRIQPFNLRISGATNHQTLGAGGKIYDVAWMQFFQGDQIRSLNYGNPADPRDGRRVLAQQMHDPAVDNPKPAAADAGSVKLGNDGSMAALVPARRALSWQLTDTNNVGIVRERYWLTFQPGEIRTCASCHGINTASQANSPVPTNTPAALVTLLSYWKTNAVARPLMTTNGATKNFQISFTRRPAETGVTYRVEASTNLTNWTQIASYAGTNIVLTGQASEVSRTGSPSEVVTVRDATNVSAAAQRFLRVRVTRP
jgi:hypothetical protein